MQQLLIISHMKKYIKAISAEEDRKERKYKYRSSILNHPVIRLEDLENDDSYEESRSSDEEDLIDLDEFSDEQMDNELKKKVRSLHPGIFIPGHLLVNFNEISELVQKGTI